MAINEGNEERQEKGNGEAAVLSANPVAQPVEDCMTNIKKIGDPIRGAVGGFVGESMQYWIRPSNHEASNILPFKEIHPTCVEA